MSVTLRDVAARVGCSVTTVSRALNGHADVGAATRARIEGAARALGYTPNASAQRLITGRTRTCGMVMPLPSGHFGDPFLLELLIGIGEALAGSGLDLIVTAAAPGAAELEAYRRLVDGRRVDGLFVSRTRVADERIAFLMARRFPFVAHGRVPGPGRFDSLEVDNLAGARLAFAALHAAGHRRFAMLNAPRGLNFAREREAGFAAAARDAGLPPPTVLEAADASEEEGERLAAVLLAIAPDVTGLFCANDRLALGAMRTLRHAGRCIGRDLGVVGYDNLPAARFAEPALTTIDQATRAAGRRLAELLVARLADGAAPPRMELWQPALTLRQSHTLGAKPLPAAARSPGGG